MSRSRIQELAMKIVDADETPQDPPFVGDMSATADTEVLPQLRPQVLGDPAHRRTKALVHASLFKGPGEAPRIGAYQVLKRLGEGGMGVVYAAYDDQLERKVALKLIRSAAMCGPEGRARTLREARALARVSHPNVVHVYQVGRSRTRSSWRWSFSPGRRCRRGWPRSRGRGGRCWRCFARRGPGWRRRTLRGWCTATSSRRT